MPPNVNPPEGEGWVKFIVNLKPNLSTGTQIKNKAVITFDINKPLATNIALNTLDFVPPTAQIASITKQLTMIYQLIGQQLMAMDRALKT